jgi:hypothetical protein
MPGCQQPAGRQAGIKNKQQKQQVCQQQQDASLSANSTLFGWVQI